MRMIMLALLVFGTAVVNPAVASAQPVRLQIIDGATQPVFATSSRIRERAFVEADMDSDADGRNDRIAITISRPRATEDGLTVATIVHASAYYSWPERDPFAEWYDEYFVTRGYAFVTVALQGTGRSAGCPSTGGPDDTRSVVAALAWLTGRADGYDEQGRRLTAGWSAGRIGMVGLSYDGALANAAAVAGVPGLRTIVPMASVSSWYDYARDQGIGYPKALSNRYPEYQASRVVSETQRPICAARIVALGDSAGDDTFDYGPFWMQRDYVRRVGRNMPAVLLVQGMTDVKVHGRQFARYWERLAEWDVPRRLWMHGGGHQDPVEVAPVEWRTMLHRWMDHWLYGVDNGVMAEPMVDLQRPGQGWTRHADWPIPGTGAVRLSLESGSSGGPGTLSATPATAPAVDSFTDNPTQPERAAIADPATHNPHRLVYWTPPLPAPVHVSGTPRMSVLVTADRTSTPLTALLIDYDSGTIVSRGSIDAKNRYSLQFARPLVPGRQYLISWTMHAIDHIFSAGHRIGLVLVANDADYVTPDPAGATIQLTTTVSGLTLPVVGGW